VCFDLRRCMCMCVCVCFHVYVFVCVCVCVPVCKRRIAMVTSHSNNLGFLCSMVVKSSLSRATATTALFFYAMQHGGKIFIITSHGNNSSVFLCYAAWWWHLPCFQGGLTAQGRRRRPSTDAASEWFLCSCTEGRFWATSFYESLG
jgi:hypothetical protein